MSLENSAITENKAYQYTIITVLMLINSFIFQMIIYGIGLALTNHKTNVNSNGVECRGIITVVVGILSGMQL